MVPGHRNGDILNCCWLLLELGAKKNQNFSISSTQAIGGSGSLAVSFQPFPDPQRIPAAIQYGMHTNHIPLHTVVDGKWKALGERTAMAVYDLMNSGVQEEGINV
jgi:hypothetical protein